MLKVLNCYLSAKKSYGTLSKGAIFFGQPYIYEYDKMHSKLEQKKPTKYIVNFLYIYFQQNTL